MSFRHACRLGALGLLVLPLGACHSVLDLDVEYQDCVDVNESEYREEFAEGELQSLRDRCWRTDNEGLAPGGFDKKIFLEDGDLIMRVDDTAGSTDLDEWSATDQAPMFYRRLEGDFLVAVRAEASSVNADHCIAPDNEAGLVVRQSDDPSVWSTWTVEPYNPTGLPEDCKESATPPASVEVRGYSSAFAEYEENGVGADGEADVAVCRVGSKVYYFYGKPSADATKNEWVPATTGTAVIAHPIGPGPLDVGVTVAGAYGKFEVTGHFNWAVVKRGVFGDGCAGALDGFVLPEDP